MKIVILGGGESGVGAAFLAKKKGFDVFLSDRGNIKEYYKKQLQEVSIEFEEGSHDEERILSADWVIKSPGIPKNADLIQKIKQKNIRLSSEIEFAAEFTDAKIIAITGSNGKTTTTSLIYYILKNSGLNVGLGGNIGKSFAMQVATENFDYYVLEISSFQLDDVQNFRPYISLLLNLSPDHLDQYNYNYKEYALAKFRIAENQENGDYFIYNKDDEMSKKLLALFLVLGLMAYAEDTETVASDTTTTESSAEENVATTEVTKQVTSENNQQLDVKEIDTEDLILQNQNLESSSVNITGENLKENGDKVKVNQENSATLEEELSRGVEKKGFFRRVLDKLFG